MPGFGKAAAVERIFRIFIKLNVKVGPGGVRSGVAVVPEKGVFRDPVALFDLGHCLHVHIGHRHIAAAVKEPVVTVLVNDNEAVAAAAALPCRFAVKAVKPRRGDNPVPQPIEGRPLID